MQIVNELGHKKPVPQNTSVGSPLYMKTKYPRQLTEQVEKYLLQNNAGSKNPVIEFNPIDGNIEENADFVRAVKLYADHPEWL